MPRVTKAERRERYEQRLRDLPAPGTGCHAALLGAANVGLYAGVSPDDIFTDLRRAIRPGEREISDSEIREAIETALRSRGSFWLFMPQVAHRTPPAAKIDEASQKRIREAAVAAGGGELDLFSPEFRRTSPIVLPGEDAPPLQELVLLLEHLYRPEDRIFLGESKASGPGQIRPASEWLSFLAEEQRHMLSLSPMGRMARLKTLGMQFPQICPNPLTGEPAPTKNGLKMTYRGDNCVADFRYAVAESDELPLLQQGALLRAICKMGLRVSAVIFSGGKSCHSWLRLDEIDSLETWDKVVKGQLFPRLGELGFDRACANAARLSRTPGMFREDKEKFQRLLYLSEKGGMI